MKRKELGFLDLPVSQTQPYDCDAFPLPRWSQISVYILRVQFLFRRFMLSRQGKGGAACSIANGIFTNLVRQNRCLLLLI